MTRLFLPIWNASARPALAQVRVGPRVAEASPLPLRGVKGIPPINPAFLAESAERLRGTALSPPKSEVGLLPFLSRLLMLLMLLCLGKQNTGLGSMAPP